tara:strand:- start:562 stop:2922 length:2361 start_codon:yes stop_codon:yes gene_type:complete
MTNSDGFSTYTDEFLEENRKFEALQKRIISEATVLEGAVYHHYNDDGSFAGISQGEPLPSTLAERAAARRALRINGSERFANISEKSPIPKESDLSNLQINTFSQLIQDNPIGFSDEISLLKDEFPNTFGDINPLDSSTVNAFSDSKFNDYLRRSNNYNTMLALDLPSLSDTSGTRIVLPDGESDKFMEKVDAKMKNYFKKISNVNDFTTNLPGELTKLTNQIGSAASSFIGRISNALQDSLVKFIDGGMAKLADFMFATNPLAKVALGKIKGFQGSLVGPVGKLFSGMECLTSKVTSAMGDVIKDMLTGMTKNMINAPTCAVQQFIGGLTNKISDTISSSVTPLLSPILGILGPIGASFDVKSAILGGIDFMKKAGDLFKCAPPPKQTGSSLYVIDGGPKKDKTQAESQNLLDAAFEAASGASAIVDKAKGFLDAGLPSGISKFEEKYGQWSIFGSKVDDAADHGIGGGNCYTGNNFSCGPATIDFFGGSGQGASGKVILGSFVSKFDKDDLFGTISRTASIMGVEITNPGQGYAEGPLVSFNDSCEQGYGAFGKAVVDQNPTSSTYGQVTGVIVLSEGTNYPTDGLPEQEAFIDTVIIENPGLDYEDAEISDDIRPVVRNGRIEAIEILDQIPYTSLPELKVLSKTGFGAIIRPIMTLKRAERRVDPTQAGIFKVVQCVGTFASAARSATPDATQSIVRESDTTTTEPVEQTQTESTQTTTQTDVSNTTTQTDTSSTTQTGTTTTSSQQTSGQSNTPSNNNDSGGSGSSGSGGGESSGGGGYGY